MMQKYESYHKLLFPAGDPMFKDKYPTDSTMAGLQWLQKVSEGDKFQRV